VVKNTIHKNCVGWKNNKNDKKVSFSHFYFAVKQCSNAKVKIHFQHRGKKETKTFFFEMYELISGHNENFFFQASDIEFYFIQLLFKLKKIYRNESFSELTFFPLEKSLKFTLKNCTTHIHEFTVLSLLKKSQ
jgi:hypothetical protein